MRRLDYLLLAVVAVLGLFVGHSARDWTPPAVLSAVLAADAREEVALAAETTLVTGDGSLGVEAGTAGGGRGAAPTLDAGEVRRRLRDGQAGTYIGELLVDHDSSLARWPERMREPLKVWVQPVRADLRDWRPEFVTRVRGAFSDWEDTGIPVFFDFVDDSARAEVHVVWTDHFDEPISGKTLWARDDEWWIVDADIALAVHHNGGDPLDAVAVRAIALHEVGHLIGLDHTSDTANIMTPKVRVKELSDADRATARLLYALPPGKVK